MGSPAPGLKRGFCTRIDFWSGPHRRTSATNHSFHASVSKPYEERHFLLEAPDRQHLDSVSIKQQSIGLPRLPGNVLLYSLSVTCTHQLAQPTSARTFHCPGVRDASGAVTHEERVRQHEEACVREVTLRLSIKPRTYCDNILACRAVGGKALIFSKSCLPLPRVPDFLGADHEWDIWGTAGQRVFSTSTFSKRCQRNPIGDSAWYCFFDVVCTINRLIKM